jgi:hypothetical protein
MTGKSSKEQVTSDKTGFTKPGHNRATTFRSLRLILTILAIVGAGAARAAWTQEIYVWQRQPGTEVAAAMQGAKMLADGFNVLAAEVEWSGGTPRVARFAPDYAQLAKLGKPVGLSLRIGPFPGPFAVGDAATKTLANLAASLLAEAQASGLSPSELQLDFDCAEAKLAGYRVWLGALKAAAGTTPLVFTALPVWLSHEADFAALAHEADGFILQVHSLERPTAPDAPFTLCDPTRALAWAAAAGRVGVPFRIALPTYGYLVAFDPAGKFFALAAEGPIPTWPSGTQVRVARADAPSVSALAHALATAPPPHCTGVIWFRLPVASDRLNWNWTTLATILQGGTPEAKMTVAVAWPEPGLAEIYAVNAGTTTEAPPTRVTLRWSAGERVLASDGLGGFQLESRAGEAQMELAATAVPPDALLAPGARRQLAWLRFSHAISLDAVLPASKP